jgi:hypothetical protein
VIKPLLKEPKVKGGLLLAEAHERKLEVGAAVL